MSAVCSWCGTELTNNSATVEFLCATCAAQAKAKGSDRANPRQEWRPWMPEAPYPKLDRGDTRKV